MHNLINNLLTRLPREDTEHLEETLDMALKREVFFVEI